jgi:uncharacterized repeat protein (TIGR01451 family)
MNKNRKSLNLLQFLFIMLCATAFVSCNQDTPDITVNTDLELTVRAITPTVQIGKNLTFTVTVKNIGANDATNVTVLNPIPQNASFVSVSSSQGLCTQKDGTVSCPLGELAVSSTASVNLVMTSNTVGTIKNTASVVANEVDISTNNNIASSSVTLQAPPPQANLQLAGTVAPNPVQIGQNLTYTFNINNTGPDTATSIQFTDVLSQNITYVSSTTSQGTCTYATNNLTLTCNLDTLSLNGTAQVKLVATPKATGTLTQTPTLRAAEVDPNTANNTTTITANVQPAPPVPTANLGLTMSATPNPVLTGQNLTYAIKLSNAGPDAASNVKIINPLPQNTTYVSSNTSLGTCAVATGTLTCNLGALAANVSASVNLVVTSKVAGTITNSASASATESDPDTNNNTASADATVQVPAKADLKLTIAAAPSPVQTGQNLTYTFTVSNAGPNDATNVNLSDPIPQNAAYISSNTAQGSCASNAGTFSCSLGTIKPNASVQVSLVVTSSVTGTLTNSASVSAIETDPVTSNNSASTNVNVQAPTVPTANLGLTNSATPTPLHINTNSTLTYTINNAGPDSATSSTFTTTLPTNAVYVSSNPSQGTCSFSVALLTCNLGSIASSGSAQVSLVLTSSVLGILNTSASVSASEVDPVTTNNISSLNITVQNPPAPGTINLPPTGKVGWDWQIGASGDSNVTVPAGVTLLDLDGFNISASKISSLKAQGIYTVCYIDAGSYEDGRPDSSLYPAYLKIYKDVQWNEWFLDVQDVFRPIQPAGTQLVNNQWVDASGKPLTSSPTAGALALLLKARWQMCADKGFDALEPDNLQNDENAGGKVTLQQQLDFNGWVADTAHDVGLAAFQKNGPDKILLKDKTGKMMVEKFDGILNEECQQFGECGPLAEYVKRGKLALNTEYAGTLDCTLSRSLVINSIMKDLSLTGGNMSGYKRQSCP